MAEQTKLRAAGEKAVAVVRAIGHDADLCLRSVNEKSTCSKCMDICPGHAIRLPKATDKPGGVKVTIGKGFCVDCGLCCAVCPTTSLLVMEPAMRSLRQVMKKAAATAGKDSHVYLTCIETGIASEDPSIVELPCLGALTEEMWVSLMLDFPNLAVFLPGELCGRCKAKAAESMIVDAVCAAQEVCGRELPLVETRRELDFTDAKGQVPSERSDMFDGISTGFADMMRDLTHGTADEDLTEEERGQSDMRKTRIRVRKEITRAEGETTPGLKGAEDIVGTLTVNRAALIDAVMRFPQIAATAMLEGVSIDAGKVEDKDALVAACPLGAIHKQQDGGLRVDPVICVRCGLCREIAGDAVTDVSTRCADLLEEMPAEEE